MEDQIVLFTDGGCRGNPGPGAWAFVLKTGGERITRSGGENFTTNNKMELQAVIEGLEFISRREDLKTVHVRVFTDSQYVQKGITSWIKNWLKNGWKTADKKPVKNAELWRLLHTLSGNLAVCWHWVKGHAGDPDNEACDELVQVKIAEIAGKK